MKTSDKNIKKRPKWVRTVSSIPDETAVQIYIGTATLPLFRSACLALNLALSPRFQGSGIESQRVRTEESENLKSERAGLRARQSEQKSERKHRRKIFHRNKDKTNTKENEQKTTKKRQQRRRVREQDCEQDCQNKGMRVRELEAKEWEKKRDRARLRARDSEQRKSFSNVVSPMCSSFFHFSIFSKDLLSLSLSLSFSLSISLFFSLYLSSPSLSFALSFSLYKFVFLSLSLYLSLPVSLSLCLYLTLFVFFFSLSLSLCFSLFLLVSYFRKFGWKKPHFQADRLQCHSMVSSAPSIIQANFASPTLRQTFFVDALVIMNKDVFAPDTAYSGCGSRPCHGWTYILDLWQDCFHQTHPAWVASIPSQSHQR